MKEAFELAVALQAWRRLCEARYQPRQTDLDAQYVRHLQLFSETVL